MTCMRHPFFRSVSPLAACQLLCKVWSEFDREGKGRLIQADLVRFFRLLPKPMGFAKSVPNDPGPDIVTFCKGCLVCCERASIKSKNFVSADVLVNEAFIKVDTFYQELDALPEDTDAKTRAMIVRRVRRAEEVRFFPCSISTCLLAHRVCSHSRGARHAHYE